MKNCIFITFDDNYFFYAKPCLNSLVKNYPNHPPVKVLYKGNNPDVLNFISTLSNVQIIDYQLDLSQFESLNFGPMGSPMIYVRLLLWTNYFDEYDTIVYLDCDTLILKPFPEVFEENDFFCVLDNACTMNDSPHKVFLMSGESDENLLSLLQKDNLEFDTINKLMINSGFFVLPKRYRTKEHLDQIWKITATYNPYIMYADQSALSIWCYLNNIFISKDYKYNFQIGLSFNKAIPSIDIDSIKIIHFAGIKPDEPYFQDFVSAAHYFVKASSAFEKYSSI